MSHVDPFNAPGGFSVGIPPELVIDETGNIVNNVNAPNSNVTANRVFANGYFYANGQPLSIGASGSNTQVQYNNNGLLGASSAFTFNSATNLLTVTKLQVGSNANLGNVANVIILGGTNGYFLQTDGAGNLTWAPAGNGGNTGNGVPGGANTQVQFNDAGQFGGDAGFTYNKTTNTLSVANTISSGNAITGVSLAVSNATVYDDLAVGNIIATNLTLSANITNANWIFASYFAGNGHNLFGLVGANVTGQVAFANVANNVAGANVSGQVGFANVANNVAGANVSGQVGNALVAGTVYTSAQPNITSVGNLTSLTVIGNTTLGNQATANYFIGNLFGTANLARNVTLAAQPNITSLGTLTSLTVSGNTTLGNSVTANYFVGNLYGVANSAIIANNANFANIANTANLANAAVLAGTVTVNAQPNITSLGTLTSLSVNGAANLGNISNITILGGSANYILSTDGSGNLNWIQQSNAVVTSPAGLNTQIQFNNAGNFGASNNFTFNSSNAYLYVGGMANFAGNVTAPIFKSNIADGTAPFVVESTTPVANLGVQTAATVRNGAQPNITSVGILTSLAVTGNITSGNLSTGLIAGTLTTNAQPNITSLGTLANITINGLANLGSVGNVKITGGTNGYVLSTDGAGNLSWVVQSNGGGNGTPGGSNTQLQYNNAGVFAGTPKLTWNDSSNLFYVGGNASFVNVVNANTVISNTVNATSITATANITAGNINGGNLISANYIAGTLTTNSQQNINYLGNIGWLNVDTAVPNSNGNIRFNGSMSGIGAASNITITGNLNAGNYVEADILVGSLSTASQPNITSLGNLTSLTVTGPTDLGNVSNITIDGGSPNYVLSTDGAGNLSWVAQSGGGGNTSPGGSNTYVQFNDGGTFGGDNTFTWNKNTNNLFVGGNLAVSNTITSQVFVSNVATGSAPLQVDSTTPVANLAVQTAATVRDNAQPNITSVGTLSSLLVSGNVTANNITSNSTFSAPNISVTGTIGTTNLNVTGTANLSNSTIVGTGATLTVNGTFNANGSGNVTLGSVGNIHISGGLNGYVLTTDGAGNLSWSAGGGGGNGTPGGSNTQVQYNDSGTFGGSSFFTFNESTNNVQIAGNLIANSVTVGAGIYAFSHSNVYFATTSSIAEQTLLSIEADDIAAVDYTIISTDGIIRNLIKISCVRSGAVLNYVEYSTLPVNGYTGDFTVSYDAGNIITPATIQLKISPQSANLMTHKMSVTTYKE